MPSLQAPLLRSNGCLCCSAQRWCRNGRHVALPQTSAAQRQALHTLAANVLKAGSTTTHISTQHLLLLL